MNVFNEDISEVPIEYESVDEKGVLKSEMTTLGKIIFTNLISLVS